MFYSLSESISPLYILADLFSKCLTHYYLFDRQRDQEGMEQISSLCCFTPQMPTTLQRPGLSWILARKKEVQSDAARGESSHPSCFPCVLSGSWTRSTEPPGLQACQMAAIKPVLCFIVLNIVENGILKMPTYDCSLLEKKHTHN